MTERDITIALALLAAVFLWLCFAMFVVAWQARKAVEIATEAVRMLKRFAGDV